VLCDIDGDALIFPGVGVCAAPRRIDHERLGTARHVDRALAHELAAVEREVLDLLLAGLGDPDLVRWLDPAHVVRPARELHGTDDLRRLRVNDLDFGPAAIGGEDEAASRIRRGRALTVATTKLVGLRGEAADRFHLLCLRIDQGELPRSTCRCEDTMQCGREHQIVEADAAIAARQHELGGHGDIGLCGRDRGRPENQYE